MRLFEVFFFQERHRATVRTAIELTWLIKIKIPGAFILKALPKHKTEFYHQMARILAQTPESIQARATHTSERGNDNNDRQSPVSKHKRTKSI